MEQQDKRKARLFRFTLPMSLLLCSTYIPVRQRSSGRTVARAMATGTAIETANVPTVLLYRVAVVPDRTL